MIMTILIRFYNHIYETGTLDHRNIYSLLGNHFTRIFKKSHYFYITHNDFENVEDELLILLEGDLCIPHEMSYLRVFKP